MVGPGHQTTMGNALWGRITDFSLIPAAFREDCSEMARLHGIDEGRLTGRRRRGTVALDFSARIPESSRQPFRNSWGIVRDRGFACPQVPRSIFPEGKRRSG